MAKAGKKRKRRDSTRVQLEMSTEAAKKYFRNIEEFLKAMVLSIPFAPKLARSCSQDELIEDQARLSKGE